MKKQMLKLMILIGLSLIMLLPMAGCAGERNQTINSPAFEGSRNENAAVPAPAEAVAPIVVDEADEDDPADADEVFELDAGLVLGYMLCDIYYYDYAYHDVFYFTEIMDYDFYVEPDVNAPHNANTSINLSGARIDGNWVFLVVLL